MFNLKYNSSQILSFVILVICLIAVSDNVDLINKAYWVSITIISLGLVKINFKFKNIVLAIYATFLLYIQFILDQYVFTEEFFIHCLGVLLIVKFAELNSKNNLLSFNLICMVISISSLINGQDLFSSTFSLAIIILLVVNLYLIQQRELMDFNFKNVLKYLGFGFSIFPIIIIFYLLFPRTEINFRLFNPSASSLGIPDTIKLGSFENFANSDEKVFTLVNQDFEKKDLYFRVKIFDYLEEDKSWRPTSGYYLYNNYKNSLKIKSFETLEDTYQIILEPYKRKWIPSLNASRPTDNLIKIGEDPFNQTFISRDVIDRKKQIEFQRHKISYEINDQLKKYYTDLPDTVSDELKNWVDQNKQNKTNVSYLNYILDTFADGTYYYNLSPEVKSENSYADFFLRNKEGYCEYFAGTFVILARLANIPSRIVSGYYGGELNTVGDFFEFRQKDTHAWAEVWLDGQGWVRVDPTSVIASSNIRNSLNDMFNNEQQFSGSFFSMQIFTLMSYYINYADFVWTRHLLSYDNSKRQSFIKDLINFKFSKVFLWIFSPIIILILLRVLFKFNKSNIVTLMFNYIVWKSKKDLTILNSDTPQEIIKKLKLGYQNKYKSFFNLYENFRYSNQNIKLTKIFRTFMSAK